MVDVHLRISLREKLVKVEKERKKRKKELLLGWTECLFALSVVGVQPVG